MMISVCALVCANEETSFPPPISEYGLLKRSLTILSSICIFFFFFFFNIAVTTQAFIKLGQYQEAITDCEWALKVSLTPKSPLTSQSSLEPYICMLLDDWYLA